MNSPSFAEPRNKSEALKMRRVAEAKLARKAGGSAPKAPQPQSQAETLRLLHELEVHQVELTMQNAELCEARDAVESALIKFTDLYDFAPVGYFTLTEEGIIKMVNLTGAEMVGTVRSRLSHQSFKRLLSTQSYSAFDIFLQRVFATLEKQSGDFELLRPGNPPKAVNIEAQRLPGLKECRVVVVDISGRKQTEEILRRNETLFATIISRAPFGIHVVDANFRLQAVNPKGMPLFENIHPLMGRDFSEIIHELWSNPTAAEMVARFRHTLRTGEPYQSSVFSEMRKDSGKEEFYQWQFQRVTLPAGEYGVICFFDDLSERVRAEKSRRRLDILTASNQKLTSEIQRRRRVQLALRKSEQHQRRLLNDSYEMQKRLQRLSHQVLHTQEEERKRISRELHDEITQTLVGINIHLESLSQDLKGNAKGIGKKILNTRRLVKRSVEIVHRFARDLRPTVLDDLGLNPALNSFIEEFQKKTSIQVRFTTFAGVEKMSTTRRTALFRVAQEAFVNAAKHARAGRMDVTIKRRSNHACMVIKDDGRAFKVEKGGQAKGRDRLGLLGMRERLEMVDGTFAIQSRPGKGTTIIATIPFSQPGRARKNSPSKGNP